MHKFTALNRQTILFPLALVLYEFCVYIGNDMVQPGMIQVITDFSAGPEWVARSLTAYLVGGSLLTWLLGPLSDRIGRRPVMLFGAVIFLISLVLILRAWDIQSFIALRMLQGVGLCYILAVGYAAIQEAFEDRAAVKVMAMMANIALLAPLIGPLVGAAVISIWSWQASFISIAVVAVLSVIGLYRYMPETRVLTAEMPKLSLGSIWSDYRSVFADHTFFKAALCTTLFGIPVILWIGLSPVILMKDLGMNPIQYGWCQVPVIGMLIAGNILVMKVADRWALDRPIHLAAWLVGAGLLAMLPAVLWPSALVASLIVAMSCFSLAQGLGMAVLYRFVMTSIPGKNGVVGAAVGMLITVVYAVTLEVSSWLYERLGVAGLWGLFIMMMGGYLLLYRGVVARAMAQRDTEDTPAYLGH